MPETTKQRLKPIEQKVITARLAGKSFCELEGNDLRSAGDKIILKTTALYGCPLPQTDFFAEVLTNELTEYINEFGYGELTVAEIELALRVNTNINLSLPDSLDLDKVTFVGSIANVHFIANVLRNYMFIRNSIERKLQNFIDGYE